MLARGQGRVHTRWWARVLSLEMVGGRETVGLRSLSDASSWRAGDPNGANIMEAKRS